jgi:tetratricopeptide (TPR) repeat protein
MEVTPGAIIPWADSAGLYELGYGAGLTGRLLLGGSPIFLGGGLSFGMIPTQATASVTLVDGGIGAGVLLQPGENGAVDLEVGARAGGYVSLYEGAGAGNPHAMGYGAVQFRISPALNLGVGGNYSYYANFDEAGNLTDPFFEGVGAFLSVRWTPGAAGSGPAQPDVEIGPPDFQRVFPVFYQYYDENPLGSVSVLNEERREIENVEVSFFAPRYMESPKVVAQFDSLDRDEEREVPLLALFNDEILGVTESTSVQARIIVSYDFDGNRFTTERAETLEVQNRNQMTWDDDRKAAAFVTAGDPTVQRLSRNVTSLTRSVGNVAVNERLRNAMAIHETLNLYGMEYVIDPDSSYIELSRNEHAMDYLQFPVQTLDYRAGDCDDLSILYCSLFEAVGIPTAFVTIPGHIFMAIDLGIGPDEAQRTFAKPEDLIYRDGTAWLPIETTVTGQDFLRAWDTGAKQYRENLANDAVGFFPVREAWQTYTPTGFSSQPLERPLPDEGRITAEYQSTLVTLVEREIAPQVEELEARIARRASPRLINRLGTLYARYGLYDQAIQAFQRAAAERPYAPAFHNIANIYYLKEELPQALEYYQRTVSLRPEDPEGRLGLARTHFELSQYGPATEQ